MADTGSRGSPVGNAELLPDGPKRASIIWSLPGNRLRLVSSGLQDIVKLSIRGLTFFNVSWQMLSGAPAADYDNPILGMAVIQNGGISQTVRSTLMGSWAGGYASWQFDACGDFLVLRAALGNTVTGAETAPSCDFNAAILVTA